VIVSVAVRAPDARHVMSAGPPVVDNARSRFLMANDTRPIIRLDGAEHGRDDQDQAESTRVAHGSMISCCTPPAIWIGVLSSVVYYTDYQLGLQVRRLKRSV